MKTVDMTTGKPGMIILKFALPLMLGNVFQQLYTFADTVVVGKVLGVNALAALGAVEWLIFLMFGFIQGLTQGFSIALSQCFGAADYKRLRKSAISAIYLSIGAAAVFTLLGQIMISPVLRLLRTPGTIVGFSESYLRVLYAGIPITIAYNLLAAILRALGNSKAPLYAMFAASVCNIILDILFVYGFGWGIGGAAFATLLSQILAAVFCLIKLKGIELLRFEKEEYALDRNLCSLQLKLGIPLGLQNVITAAGGLIVQSVINGFGVLFIAGYTAAGKLYGLLEMAASSYGYAMSSYAGQNMGAGRPDRVRKGLQSATVIGILTACLMSVVMLTLGKPILGCFISGDEETIKATIRIGYQFLMVLAGFFPLLYVLYIIRACLQGMGNTILPMVSSIGQLVMRTGCALLLPLLIGESGVFWGEILAWICADVILYAGYLRTMRNSNELLKNKPCRL